MSQYLVTISDTFFVTTQTVRLDFDEDLSFREASRITKDSWSPPQRPPILAKLSKTTSLPALKTQREAFEEDGRIPCPPHQDIGYIEKIDRPPDG